MTKRRHVGQCPLSSANETWSPGQTAQRPRTRTSSMPAHWGYDLLRDAKDLLALVAAFELPPQRLRRVLQAKRIPPFQAGWGLEMAARSWQQGCEAELHADAVRLFAVNSTRRPHPPLQGQGCEAELAQHYCAVDCITVVNHILPFKDRY